MQVVCALCVQVVCALCAVSVCAECVCRERALFSNSSPLSGKKWHSFRGQLESPPFPFPPFPPFSVNDHPFSSIILVCEGERGRQQGVFKMEIEHSPPPAVKVTLS